MPYTNGHGLGRINWVDKNDSIEPTSGASFGRRFEYEVVGHPFFELELVTKKFSNFEHLNSVNAITVEGFDGNRPFSFRLGGLLENGFPLTYWLICFSQQPFQL